MPDWNTRLAAFYNDGTGDVLISPLDGLNVTFSTGTEQLNSVEATHIGVIYNPKTINFTITARAIGPVVAQLTKLALDGTRFSIIIQEQTGDDWSFSSEALTDCIITSASPSNVTVAGAPTASFSGFSLAASVTDAAEQPSVTEVP
jgi:hypothetical protein